MLEGGNGKCFCHSLEIMQFFFLRKNCYLSITNQRWPPERWGSQVPRRPRWGVHHRPGQEGHKTCSSAKMGHALTLGEVHNDLQSAAKFFYNDNYSSVCVNHFHPIWTMYPTYSTNMYDEDPPLGGVGTSCTPSRKYMMFGLGLGQKKKKLPSVRGWPPLSTCAICTAPLSTCARVTTFVRVCMGDHSPKPSLNCSPANRPHQLVPSKGQMLKPRRKKSPKLLKLEESNTNDLCQETPQ